MSETTAVTLITGASSGLGAALAPLLAADGHVLALGARRIEPLQELASEIEATGGRVLAVPMDVSDREAVRSAFDTIESELGPVECLVANAGRSGPLSAKRFDTDKLHRVMSVNFFGAAYCIERALPGMIERKRGHIIGVSSLAGFRGMPGFGSYNASKAALITLLEGLRIEGRRLGIDVTVVCPGFVKTPLTADNKFPMPFLMEVEDAAARIHKAIRRRERLTLFPWPMRPFIRLMQIMPAWMYDLALGSMAPKG